LPIEAGKTLDELQSDCQPFLLKLLQALPTISKSGAGEMPQ